MIDLNAAIDEDVVYVRRERGVEAGYYGIHDRNGKPVGALYPSWDCAFLAARQFGFVPMSAH